MNNILVDSSVWISFFKGQEHSKRLVESYNNDLVVTNDLILSELIPAMEIKKEFELIKLLRSIEKIELKIDWNDIRRMQVSNLQNGINKVGIPDIIIAQQAIQNNLRLFTFDKHFMLMSQAFELNLITQP